MKLRGILQFVSDKIIHNKPGFLILLIIISILLYLPFIYLNDFGIRNDETTFLFMAEKVMDGSVPYKDYFDHKPPGIYYIYSFFLLALGTSVVSIRIGVFLFNLGTAIAVYLIGNEIEKKYTGQVASIFFLICVSTPGTLGFVGQTEPFMMFFVTLSVLFYIKSKEGSRTWLVLISGLMLGLATMLKQSAFLLLFGFYIYFLLGFWLKENRNLAFLKRKVWHGIILALGIIIIWLPVLFYYFIKGAFNDLVFAVFLYNADYSSFSGFSQYSLTYIWNVVSVYPYLWIFGTISLTLALLRFVFKKRYDNVMLLAVISLVLSTQLLIRQNPYYFVTLLPFFAVFTGTATAGLIKILQQSFQKAPTPAPTTRPSKDQGSRGFGFILIFIIVSLLILTGFNISRSYSPIPDEFGKSEPVKYIKEHTDPGDKIYIFGSNPAIYVETGRDPPSKYFFLLPWTASDEIQQDIMDGIEKHRVRYIIVLNHSYMIDKDDEALFAEDLYNYIKQNYRMEASWGERSETDLWAVKTDIYVRYTTW